jgi:hypothetical protein
MAIQIILSVPDQHVTRILEAFTGLAGKSLELSAHGDDFHGNWDYEFAPKDIGESDKEFVVRAIKENIKAVVKLYDYAEDRSRYNSEISAITQPSQDVPEDIIE